MSKLKGVENLTEISIALTSAIHKLDSSQKGPRRICIDLVSDVLLQHHAVQTRRWLTALTAELKSMGFTTLAVVDPRMHPPEELYAILGLFEGGDQRYRERNGERPRKIPKDQEDEQSGVSGRRDTSEERRLAQERVTAKNRPVETSISCGKRPCSYRSRALTSRGRSGNLGEQIRC